MHAISLNFWRSKSLLINLGKRREPFCEREFLNGNISFLSTLCRLKVDFVVSFTVEITMSDIALVKEGFLDEKTGASCTGA